MRVGDFCSRRCVILAFALLMGASAFAVESSSQSTRQLSNVGRRLDDFNNQSTKAERDQMNNEIRGKKPSAEELKRAALLKAQLKEDLGSLQDEYNALVTKLKANETISAKEAAEIGDRVHLRSERLLKNLNLPVSKPDDATERAAYSNDTNKLLRSLCAMLFEFITNPMFESPSALDVEAAGKARSTLEELIRLSDHVRRRV